MVQLTRKINFFDLIMSISLLLVLAVIFVAIFKSNQPYLGSSDVSVEIVVYDLETIENIQTQLDGTNELYYNGTAYTVDQTDYELIYDEDGKLDNLIITIKGLGDIGQEHSIFMGFRIYSNQKVELRGNYFIQGSVRDYYVY